MNVFFCIWSALGVASAADVQVGAGGAFGVDVGWGTPLASPVVTLGAVAGGGSAWFDIAIETQPTLFHSIGYDVGGVPLAMLTLGPDFGSERLVVGPYVTAGVLALGGGGRVRGPVKINADGSRHNVEIRAGYLHLSNVEAMLIWTFQTRIGRS